MITLDVQGLAAVQQRLAQLAQAIPRQGVVAVQAEAHRILEASYPLVPVDTGALISSGADLALPDGAEIRYGNHGAVPYAAIVHESVEMNHPHGGEHHFLSKVFYEATADMLQRLVASIRV
jgi:hypothetical protein